MPPAPNCVFNLSSLLKADYLCLQRTNLPLICRSRPQHLLPPLQPHSCLSSVLLNPAGPVRPRSDAISLPPTSTPSVSLPRPHRGRLISLVSISYAFLIHITSIIKTCILSSLFNSELCRNRINVKFFCVELSIAPLNKI